MIFPHLRDVVVVVVVYSDGCTEVYSTVRWCGTGVPTRDSVNERSVQQSDLAQHTSSPSVAPGSSSENVRQDHCLVVWIFLHGIWEEKYMIYLIKY